MGKEKKITLIIGGGIAAYKSLELIRLLQKESIEVIPILTKSAENFVTSLSLAAISKKKVYSDLFDYENESVESIVEKIEYAIEQHSSFLKVISKEDLAEYEKMNKLRKWSKN